MPDLNNPLQPFMNLMQANMTLLAKYAISPEGMTQAMAQFQAAMTPGPNGGPALPKTSPDLAGLVQGMMQNYTQFMTELAQVGMAALAQGQATMLQQAQDAADSSSKSGSSGRSR